MIIVISIMLCGVGIGYKFRNRKFKLVSPIIMLLIFFLLFFLGVSVGGNNDIMNNLAKIGLDALIITLGAVIGSCLAAMAVYRIFFKKLENEG